ncbi:cytochrome P450 [Leucogyrophana mollusca]|uniref:Cytochrome P450 n=1 Tax=Leucogyrophana mollusca TaxID=85980 RepID=A0ACB8BW26_9AGAM|nr:cytochrome P450 [Leucogyrophana mollusca]
MFQKLALSASLALLGFGLWKVGKLAVHRITSPLRNIRGPKSTSWLYGNMKDIFEAENSVLHEQWVKEYGPTLKYQGFLNIDRLFTMDLRALNHVLTHSNDYQKPEQVRYNLSQILGEGVLFVEGAQHRQQRRIMVKINSNNVHIPTDTSHQNPAFGPAQIRGLTEVFLAKSIKLRDVLMSVSKDESGNAKRTDIMAWLSRMTLDVIGLAGFNYEFNALDANDKQNELNEAFSTMFSAGRDASVLPMLQGWIPPLRAIPTDRGRKIGVAQKTMGRIGRELLRDAKAAVMASQGDGKNGVIEKSSMQGRDLLTLLVRANMATDIPDSQKLSDEDVLAQVPTFLVAGHETTSTATTWALFSLTQRPEVQTKLREELFTLETETPSMDELSSLPYLDAVVRETLRVHAPVPSTVRIAMKDDVLPLDTPFTDKKGRVQTGIKVNKGDPIFIPILAINRSEALWGPDAAEFKPERWESIPDSASHIPGVWGHLLTFLGGPRACIGYRFSLIEMKALLFTLVRAFEFELAVPGSDIGKKSVIVQRPFVRSEPDSRSQMPLLIKPFQRT